MKNFKHLFFLTAIALGVAACSPQKRIIYFQDVQDNAAIQTAQNQQIRIKPLDRLTIVVSSKDPELAAPFNATTSYNSLSSNPLGASTSNGAQSLQVRTVDEKGYLYMPIIGEVYCAGKTRSELADEISKEIIGGGYISDASVNIQFADMKVFVLGEVARPGQFDITRDQVTILEALAMAGDMTIFGNRSNVSVHRNNNGENKVFVLDLLKSDCFTSPGFYLQQGDVIYVQPNKYKAATAEINQNRTFWVSIVSTLLSATSIILAIMNYTKPTPTK